MSDNAINTFDVLVTGAAGFIGSHVSESLLKKGYNVLGVDELNDYYNVGYKKKNLDILSAFHNFSFLRIDISDISQIEKHLQSLKIKKIAHIAARAGVRPSIKNPLLYQKVNVEGTLNILELARKMEVENLLITSSSSVYGNSTKVPFKEDDSATDRPISPYAATKKASEVLAHTYSHLYGIPTTIIRPFTVYGPRGRPDMAPWLFLKSCLNEIPIMKFGDGSSKRDYTYIDDFVRGFVNALNKPQKFEIFNLGNSHTISLNEAISIIEDITRKPMIIEQKEMQAGDVNVTNADISKAKKQLDYHPKTDFREGMSLFHEWFKENIK